MSAEVNLVPGGTERSERVEATANKLVDLLERAKNGVKRMLGYLKKKVRQVVAKVRLGFASLRARRRTSRANGQTNTQFVAHEVAEVKERSQERADLARHEAMERIITSLRRRVETMVEEPVPVIEAQPDDTIATKLAVDVKNIVTSVEFLQSRSNIDLTDKADVAIARGNADLVNYFADLLTDVQTLHLSVTSNDNTFQLLADTDYPVRLDAALAWLESVYRAISPQRDR